eukprot:12839340-Ditylum_brightwellii.AAC.1
MEGQIIADVPQKGGNLHGAAQVLNRWKVGLRNAPRKEEREEILQEDESQQDKLGLNCNKQIPVATVVNTAPPETPEEEE